MKRYLITDPFFYSSTACLFAKKLQEVLLQEEVDFVCIRDKESSDYEALIQSANPIIRNSQAKLIVHRDLAVAKNNHAYGIHLPYIYKADIQKAKEVGLFVIASVHTLQEALHVQELGADAITYSPIFYTPNKGKPKGLEKLKEINDKIDIHCFALGGIIEEEHIQACRKAGVYGFASIRYFLKKVSVYV